MRKHTIGVPVADAEYNALKMAADSRGLALATFVRWAALEIVRQISGTVINIAEDAAGFEEENYEER